MKHLSKFLSLLILSFVLFACSENNNNPVNNNNNTLDSNQVESKKGFDYLNLVRLNPGSYSTDIGVNLSSYATRPKLVWNSILAKVAEQKALDMATRNYFSHQTPEGYGINYLINKAGYTLPVGWLVDSSANNFESIAAAYKTGYIIGGVDFIKQLIVDAGVPDLGHRYHLLGVGDWFASLVDCGIGIARNPNSTYKNYCCVIIAKQK